MDEIELLIKEYREAAMAHGAESTQYSVLGVLFDPGRTKAVMQAKEDQLRGLIHEMINKENGVD